MKKDHRSRCLYSINSHTGIWCGQDNLNVDLDSEYSSRSCFGPSPCLLPIGKQVEKKPQHALFLFLPNLPFSTKSKHADAEHSGHVLLIEEEGKGFAHSEDTSALGAFQMRRDQVHSDPCKHNQGIQKTKRDLGDGIHHRNRPTDSIVHSVLQSKSNHPD